MAKHENSEDDKTVERPDAGRPSLGTGIAEEGATVVEKRNKEAIERQRRMDEMLGIKRKKKSK